MSLSKELKIGVPVALGAPLAVCAGRAVACKKELPDKEPAVKWTKEEEQLYAEKLSAMVQIPTISKKQDEPYEDFITFQKKLAELFPRVFATFENHDVDGNLLRRWKGSDPSKNGVLFMGHQDVVPVDQAGWTKDPFSGAIEDGCVWGCGSMDCKSTVFCELQAMEELLEQGFVPKQDIWFSASRNEENSGGGAEAAVNYLKESGVKLDLVMDEGGAIVTGLFPGLAAPVAGIGVLEKGFVNVKFTAKSDGGHASAPPPHTPVGILSRACCALEDHPFPAHITEPVAKMFDTLGRRSSFVYRIIFANLWCFGSLLGALSRRSGGEMNALLRTTVAFTMMQGSSVRNVLPPEAAMVANIRLNPADSMESALEYVRKTVDDPRVELTVLQGMEPSRISKSDGDAYRKVADAVEATWPGCIATPYLMVQCSDSRHYGSISDRVYRFSAMDLTKEERGLIHGNNERIRVETVGKAVEFYIRLMRLC